MNTKVIQMNKRESSPVSRILSLPRGTARLEMLGEKRTFPKNAILARQGEKPSFCYVILKGKVAAREFTAGGEERVYNINEKNSVLLEENLLFDWECQVEFKVIRPVEAVCITKRALLEAIMMDPETAMDVIQSLSTKFVTAMEQLRHVNHYSAEWRLCELLLNYADFYGVPYDGKTLIQEKISQQVMSNLLGINRITAVRAIKDLKDMGLVENINGFYCIRDVEKLRRHQQRLE